MHKYFFGLLILLYMEDNSYQRQILIECTTNCKCDTWESFRRAKCENGKMLNVKGNVPNHTEILEFSYNYVTELNNEELYNSGLSSLKLANLSHNKIKEIHIYAFDKMAELQTLDLSHNALQYILPEWFWPLLSLRELYMNNNNLGALENRPLFSSKTLQILNLAYCQIPHIEVNALQELPLLQSIDFTGNYIIEISSDVLKPCVNLSTIKLQHNKIVCNNVGMFFTAYCLKNGISLDDNFCKKSEPIQMQDDKLERMVDAHEEPDVKNVWVYEIKEIDEEENSRNYTVTCEKKSIIIEIYELSPILTISLLLIIGFLAGLIVGCSCEIKGAKQQKKEFSKNSFSRRYSFIRGKPLDIPGSEQLILNIHETQSTPIVLRRQLSANLY